jgi:hypothetical protein
MRLELAVKGISGSTAVWTAGGYRESSGGQRSFGFAVAAKDSDHLDLATGEIFQDALYAKFHKSEEKLISATLFIGLCPPDEQQPKGQLSYFKGHESKNGLGEDRASEIHFSYHLPRAEFDILYENVLAGFFPRDVVVDLDDGAIAFGWEPDGSGKKWDNVTKTRLQINELEFRFDYLREDEEGEDAFLTEPHDRKSFSDYPRVARNLVERVSAFHKTAKEFFWFFAIAFLILIWRQLR